MHPVIWLALVGASFFLGRSSKEVARRRATARQLPIPSPIVEPLPSVLPVDFTSQWAAATYPIHIFPPEAEPRVEALLPPPSPDGISIAAGCQAVAIGEGWWGTAHEIASEAKYDRKLSDSKVVDAILRVAAPTCRGRTSTAISAFRMSLMAHVQEMPDEEPTRNPPYETTVTR